MKGKTVVTNGNMFMPTAHAVRACLFETEADAELINAVAEHGQLSGMSTNEIQHIIPIILRIMKSKSDWTK